MFYNYKIKKIERVVDGDTFDAFIDLGFNTLVKKRIRIYGINCPECRTRNKKEKEKGLLAKKFLQQIFESFENSISIFLEIFNANSASEPHVYPDRHQAQKRHRRIQDRDGGLARIS